MIMYYMCMSILCAWVILQMISYVVYACVHYDSVLHVYVHFVCICVCVILQMILSVVYVGLHYDSVSHLYVFVDYFAHIVQAFI
jgi:hypothetical protein